MTPPPSATAGPDQSTPGDRRRSGFVTLGMVGTLALTLAGCSSSSGSAPSRCVDPTTLKVLDRHSCSAGTTGAGAGRWYYCGYGTDTASGGTFDKAATKRGGFGCPKGSSSGSGGG
ncbi:hypothetical protein [Streptomyces sp. TLI_171]|uniref:hypothetical protein n=1 Tax=Streptomyces sp. TLI_171 TaxID=1938859 RepID=UPI000C44F335|nr:hypothetical protein [Streptomyces sp. TLI_171]RKE23245.1 hypothetical protein BX266_6706 [Streptomyces sp. TLI_171]